MQTKKISEERKALQQELIGRVREQVSGKSLTYYVETYGCQMNARDSETISALLEEMGYQSAANKEAAKVILFNTCCVRDHAEKKLLANIGALRERKEQEGDMILGICGCMMQQQSIAQKLLKRFPFVDLVFGTNVLWRLPEMLYEVNEGGRVCLTDEEEYAICEGLPARRLTPYSAYVNITYGCDNFCTYCIVPFVRGRERSRNIEDIVTECRSLAQDGVTEITLLGQNVNSYGKGLGVDFSDLLREVNKVKGLQRIRFISSHPKDLTPRLMDAMAENDKVCRHIHLPVQSGSTRILKEMNRRYTRDEYLALVASLRQRVPGVELTTDVIVGFPGETEEDFDDTLSLMEQVGFSAAFTFKYSPRAGTKAALMPNQVPESIKKDRLRRLNEVQARKTQENNQKYLGVRGQVLVEGCDLRDTPTLYGKLDTFKMVYFSGDPTLVGTYQQVEIQKCVKNSLHGKLL